MKLRNLSKENSNYHSEYFYLTSSHFLPKKERTPEQKEEFQIKWKDGIATLADWLQASPAEIAAAEEAIDSQTKQRINARKTQLYDWYLEFKAQKSLSTEFKNVLKYTPGYLRTYAKQELDKLALFMRGEMDPQVKEYYTREKGLDSQFDYFKVNLEELNESKLDIHDTSGAIELEVLHRYKEYLKRFEEEGLDDENVITPDDEPFAFATLWPEIIKLSKEIVVNYITKHHHYKDESFVNYDIVNVAGAYYASGLKQKLLRLFKPGWNELLSKLQQLSSEERLEVLEILKEEAEELKSIVIDGEYKVEESEYHPEKTYYFKKFSHLYYEGDNDLRFASYKESREFLDKKLGEFAESWLSGIDEIIRKFEHFANDLEIFQHVNYKKNFDVKTMLNSVFVLESEEGAIQGTAFHLVGYGLLTCDHCIRNPVDGLILKDLVIFRANDIGKKMSVTVELASEILDLAKLTLSDQNSTFLEKGLQLGEADSIEYGDSIAVAGFPNYNFGDTGYFSTGNVTGFRMVSGVRHILTSVILVAGNSGGPVLDEDGNVIGVVATGADNFRDSSKTEKHGLIPIEALKYLDK